MLKKFMMITAAIVMLFTFPAIAAVEIPAVVLDITPEDEMNPGDIYSAAEPRVGTNGYYITEFKTSSTSETPKHSYTYTLTIEPYSGYSFSDATSVTCAGAYSVTITTKQQNKMVVKVLAYPFHVLANPVFTQTSGTKLAWNSVNYASGYNVVIYWEDKNGEEHSTTKSTTTNSIDIASYTTTTGSRTFTHASVQAKKGTKTGDEYIANSRYIDSSSGGEDEFHSVENFTFSYPTATVTAVNAASSSSSSGNQTTSTAAVSTTAGTAQGWMQMNGNWYYLKNGIMATGWVNPIGNDWYYLDANGVMSAGLVASNGFLYLLNPNHDGTYGKMLTGWQVLNGQYYYFNALQGNGIPFGAMYVNAYTPDGHYVNGFGVREY